MNKILNICLLINLLLFEAATNVAAQQMNEMWGEQKGKSVQPTNQRGHLFEWGNYAMFIHWGLFSHLEGVWKGKTYYGICEWMMDVNMANADKSEYRALARSFNPTEFDAMEIAQLAKDAGMKYIIITSKHHDGFAMFHSKCDKFNIVDATPFKRDPMKELAEACKKVGIGFGFYYSHNQDWLTPGAFGAPSVDLEGNPKTFDDYFYGKCLPQVEEITKNYGDIELIWFDTPAGIPENYAKKLVETVHANQPRALVSGRVGYGLGDYQTLGDMEVPLENIDGLWESVDVTNDAWGYVWYDQNWKSPKQILQNLISTVARGGTYMLNIGPDGKGNVPEFVSQSLKASGRWIASHPQVIYGAEPSPWKHALPWGDVVKQNDKLYLAVYEWPASGQLYLPGLQTEIRTARILLGEKSKKVKFDKEGDWTVLQVPCRQPESLIPIIELQLQDSTVKVDNTQALDPEIGIRKLSVQFAQVTGCNIHKSSWMEKFGEWKHAACVSDLTPNGKVEWTIDVKETGIYQLSLEARGEGRCVWKAMTDEGKMVQNQQGVSSKFSECPMGWIRFDQPGKHTLSLTQLEGKPADLSSVSLIPVTFN